ncbi:hypothetical protein D3C73_1304800 [compost metagenome]
MPKSPLSSEPTTAIAPTQNNKLAVTKPNDIDVSLEKFLALFSMKLPKRINLSSIFIASPSNEPMAIEITISNIFSPFKVPEIPMYITHKAIPLIIVSVNLLGSPPFNKTPIIPPTKIVKKLTIVPNIFKAPFLLT